MSQQYAHAVNSSNLRDYPGSLMDILAAAGLTAREYSIGVILVRVKHAGDNVRILPLRMAWREMTLRRAERKGWADVAEEVADISLDYWLSDLVCPTCKGTGHRVIDGTPVLEAEVCRLCHGRCKKPLFVADRTIRRYVEQSVDSLDSITRAADGIINDTLLSLEK